MSFLKTIISFSIITFFITPSFSQTPNYEPLADSFNVSNPNAVQAINIPYGDSDPSKQLFHIFLPNTEDTFPLVIFFHGGGFTDGNPGTVFKDPERRETVKYFLENNVAFISLGYRLIAKGEPDLEGVIKCLNDSKLGLQFIRHYAANLNIDPDRIALMGSSAGAGTSMWLGFRDDMADPNNEDPVLRESTRVNAVFASGSQSTYDLYKWETDIFNNFDGQGTNFTLDSIAEIMTYETSENFYGGLDSLYQIVHDPELIQYRQDVDMLHHLSDDDPPFYIFSKNTADHPSDDVLHHWYHSRELYEIASNANLSEVKAEIKEYDLDNTEGESGNEFLLRYLVGDVDPPDNPILGIDELSEVKVFPNPASTHFFVNLDNDQVQTVEVISLSGTVLTRESNYDTSQPIPISTLNKGIYLVKVIGSKSDVMKRLVVK